MKTKLNRRVASLFVILLVAFTACKKDDPQTDEVAAAPTVRNVILISIDTLRADALKIYSSRGADTPALQSLAAESVVFEKVIAPVPTTLPSHCSMLTGVFPAYHQVKDNVRDVLPAGIRTVAEQFQSKGYQTAGFAGSMVLGRHTGLARGFDYYDDRFSRSDARMADLGAIERPAEDVVASFRHWLNNQRNGKPLFAFIHFYDPHSPFQPPAAFAPTESSIRGFYHGEVRYTDSAIDKLFSLLKQNNLWNNTMVVVTSDHGEMLGEHGETGHGFFLYRAALEVPLIVKLPGTPAGKVSEVVQLTDLPATLFEAAGIQSGMQQGESLIPLIRNSARKKDTLAYAETYFPSLQLGTSPLKSVQDARYKFISAPVPELYDLVKDPAESNNLAAENSTLAQQFRQRLQTFEQNRKSGSERAGKREVTSEEVEQFAALGYIGGSVPESSWSKEKDPKQFIGEWNDMLQATSLVDQGQYAEALKLIEKVKKETSVFPSSIALLESRCHVGLGNVAKAEALLKSLEPAPEATSGLAEVYARSGNVEKASASYRKLLEKDFSYFTLYSYLAVLVKSGKQAEATAYLEETLKKHQPTEQNLSHVAEINMLLGRNDEAEKQLLALAEKRPWESKWHMNLAAVYQSKGEIDRALSYLTSHSEQFQDDPEYLLQLGVLYRMSNQPVQELESFRKMLKLNPRDPRPYFYLAKAMLDYRGKPENVIDLCRRGFALRPRAEMQIFGLYILSDAYRAAGNPAEAQKALQMAQRLEKMS